MDFMEMNKQSAANKLVKRIEWLAFIFRGVAIGLMSIGIVLPAIGAWLFENSFGYACFGLIAFGLLFALGFGYCRLVLREYERSKETNREG